MKKTTSALVAALALALPVGAQAHRAHKAQTPTQLIQRAVGPGTVVEACWRIQLGLRCDYSTLSANFGVHFEEEANGFRPESGSWSSYADVIHGRVLLVGLE